MRLTPGPALSLASQATRLDQRKRNPMTNPTDEIQRLAAKVTEAADTGDWETMNRAAAQLAEIAWEVNATHQRATDDALRCPECRSANLNEVGVAGYDIPVCVTEGGTSFGPVEIFEFPVVATYRCQDCDSGELTADTLVTAQTI